MKKKKEKKMATNSKSKWTRVGTLRKRVNDAGVEIPYIVVNKNIKLVDRESGEEINLGKYLQISLLNPLKGLDTMKASGAITVEKYEEQLKFIEDKNVKYELTIPPQKD